eukprot:scaffold298675_cov18-Tisochrysis_lutea.AAC.2
MCLKFYWVVYDLFKNGGLPGVTLLGMLSRRWRCSSVCLITHRSIDSAQHICLAATYDGMKRHAFFGANKCSEPHCTASGAELTVLAAGNLHKWRVPTTMSPVLNAEMQEASMRPRHRLLLIASPKSLSFARQSHAMQCEAACGHGLGAPADGSRFPAHHGRGAACQPTEAHDTGAWYEPLFYPIFSTALTHGCLSARGHACRHGKQLARIIEELCSNVSSCRTMLLLETSEKGPCQKPGSLNIIGAAFWDNHI